MLSESELQQPEARDTNGKTAKETPKRTNRHVQIKKVEQYLAILRIKGETDYIPGRFDPDVLIKRTGSDKTTEKARLEARTDAEVAEACKYFDSEERDCIPARAFKKAMMMTAMITEQLDVTWQTVQSGIRIPAEFIPISVAAPPVVRIDTGRNRQMKARPGIRIVRPAYHDWECELPLIYWTQFFALDPLIELVMATGFAIGIGCDRTERGAGSFGAFRVESAQDMGLYFRYGSK